MTFDFRLMMACSALQLLSVGATHAASLPRCAGPAPTYHVMPEDVKAHRLFELPEIVYPADSRMENVRLFMIFVVDARGRVKCVIGDGRFFAPYANKQRSQLLNSLVNWRYKPFVIDGAPRSVAIAEHIREVQLPRVHIPLPNVPMEDVQITLERSGCFGACPAYRVDVYGDGRVVYEGHYPADVAGRHVHHVPRESVAQLIQSIRDKDVWSLRDSFRVNNLTDLPTYKTTLRFGTEVHSVEDYGGDSDGMPKEVTEIENEIDAVAEPDVWLYLSKTAIARLEEERFDFRSSAAGHILWRAIANPVTQKEDEEAMLELINRGAPLTYWTVSNALGQDMTLLQLAHAQGYKRVAAALFSPPHPWQTVEMPHR